MNQLISATAAALKATNWTSPTYWLILAATVVLTAFIGPFGSSDSFSFAFGLVYWGLSVFLCAPIGSLFVAHVKVRGWPGMSWVLVLSLIFGVVISLIVWAIGTVMLQPIGQYPGSIHLLFYGFTSAAFIIFSILVIMNRSGFFNARPCRGKDREIQERPRLLHRLPELAQATEIWALSAQDHYVRVITDQGAALTLIRLSDAIAECDGTLGIQIHRSHWVAMNAIQQSCVSLTMKEVELKNGMTFPISHSKSKNAKNAISNHFNCTPIYQ